MKQEQIQLVIMKNFHQVNMLKMVDGNSMNNLVTTARTIGNLTCLISNEAGKKILKKLEGNLGMYWDCLKEYRPHGRDDIKRQYNAKGFIADLQDEFKTVATEDIREILVDHEILR